MAREESEVPFAIFKPTALGRFKIWHKVSSRVSLSDKEKEEWERVQQRVEGLCEKAHKLKVRLYADAEESWMQEAADLLMEKMMARFNKEEIEANYQALMYSLATFKQDGIIPEVKFLFLRFPDRAEQAAPKLTEEELDGFEIFLSELADLLSDYNEDKAVENLAKNGTKYRWLCQTMIDCYGKLS